MKASPRILIAGTNSGVGKTSITIALVNALKKRGLKVQTFKVGPDYLDPTYLSNASGLPCYNLDAWMTSKNYMIKLFTEKTSECDIAVIEGVMGLFDGSDPVTPEGSTAEIAELLNCPIFLVINAHGLSRSVAPLVKGYVTFDPNLNIAGVIANHCGSSRHGKWLGESLAAFQLPSLIASIPKGAFPELPSRHLGLVTADCKNLTPETLDLLGCVLEEYGSVDTIIAAARNAPEFSAPDFNSDEKEPQIQVRLGIAYDSAFHFYYPDNLEALAAAGCELVYFSPVADETLPKGLDGLYFGGGYPEEHASALSQNKTMIESVRSFAQSGKPIYAECGGLMYLSRGIEVNGCFFDLVGLIPARTRMLKKRKFLGYTEITLMENSLFGTSGSKLKGHEFHYSELIEDPSENGEWKRVYSVVRRRSEMISVEGYQKGMILASYVHAHFASKPGAVRHFVSICRQQALRGGPGYDQR